MSKSLENRRTALLAAIASLALVSPALADLIDTRIDTDATGATVDGIISTDEYGLGNAYSYTGAGTGFGGTVGTGTIYFNSDATNLYIGFNAGAAVNDLVAILLDTREGGFTDAQMNDNSDGGRRAVSQLAINADDVFDPNFLPDFGLVFATFGSVLFELTADPDPLNFLNFDGNGAFPREYAIPLATLGVAPGGNVGFIVAYTADSTFGSNESIPAYEPLNSGPNPGFDATSAGYGNYNVFTVYEEATFVEGDADSDGDVDFDDLGILLGNYDLGGFEAFTAGDSDGDGDVDFDDLGLLLGNYGFGVGAPGSLDAAAVNAIQSAGLGAAIPEPSSMALLAPGALLLARRRR